MAILSLSLAASLLTEHGISLAFLYLQHMQESLPRCVTITLFLVARVYTSLEWAMHLFMCTAERASSTSDLISPD